MLYPDDSIVARLRKQDPHGLRSNADLQRAALLEQVGKAVDEIQDDALREILEAIVGLL